MTPADGRRQPDLRRRRKVRSRCRALPPRARPRALTQGVPTTGRIPNGALVEREGPGRFADEKVLVLELRNPRLQHRGQRGRCHQCLHASSASASRSRARPTCAPSPCRRPSTSAPPRFMAEIGELPVRADVPARVVIDERTGTIVIGRDVQVSTVAVTHGNLTVRVTEMPQGLAAAALLAAARRSSRRETDRRRRREGRQPRHRPRHQPADAGARPEPDRTEAAGHHRHPAGDQVGRRPAGGPGGAMMRATRNLPAGGGIRAAGRSPRCAR